MCVPVSMVCAGCKRGIAFYLLVLVSPVTADLVVSPVRSILNKYYTCYWFAERERELIKEMGYHQ